jgi:RNA polymerase sigma-70 factor (sigma-E family)
MQPLHRSRWSEWVEEEVAVDANADEEFSQFMHGRWAQMVRLAYALTGDQQHAEDVAQTAFARAYASWARVRKASDPGAYVRRIVVNANRSRFRKLRVRELLTDSIPELVAAADLSDEGEERAVLKAALMDLPAGQRAAVVLRYWLDLSEAETAAALGCSAGNVKSQAARGLAKLRANAAVADGGLR